MIPATHQLKGLREPFGLICAPQDKEVLRKSKEATIQLLVHQLFLNLREARQNKSAEALHKALTIVSQLSSMGWVAIILEKGKIAGAGDPRFSGKDIQLDPLTVKPSEESQFARYERIRRMIERLPSAEREKLLLELQAKWKTKQNA